jgi:hypothetical protein
MQKKLLFGVAVLAAPLLVLAARRGPDPVAASPDLVARGRYLANSIGLDVLILV